LAATHQTGGGESLFHKQQQAQYLHRCGGARGFRFFRCAKTAPTFFGKPGQRSFPKTVSFLVSSLSLRQRPTGQPSGYEPPYDACSGSRANQGVPFLGHFHIPVRAECKAESVRPQPVPSNHHSSIWWKRLAPDILRNAADWDPPPRLKAARVPGCRRRRGSRPKHNPWKVGFPFYGISSAFPVMVCRAPRWAEGRPSRKAVRDIENTHRYNNPITFLTATVSRFQQRPLLCRPQEWQSEPLPPAALLNGNNARKSS